MGAKTSTGAGKPEFANLSIEQLRKAESELRRRTKGENLSYDQFMEVYSELQPAVNLIYAAVQHNHRCSLSSILMLADNLLGDAVSQSSSLLKIFGTVTNALSGTVSMYAHRHRLNTSESAALLDYLLVDAPNDEASFHRWLLGHSVASQLILHVFSPLLFQKGESLLPSTSYSSLFSHSAAIVINMNLPANRRDKWTLLFSSVLHGSSFSQMATRINGEGSCIVAVMSTSGRIFGCFASAGFLMGPRYYGDATSFLFEVKPHIRIFCATGLAENYAYLNSQQCSLPNGMGIGGYESAWPFFICEEYGTGITLANICSFEKCHLSGSDSFAVSAIEVWRVGEKLHISVENEDTQNEKSIIDRDPQARAILEISGRTMHSDGYREPASLSESFLQNTA